MPKTPLGVFVSLTKVLPDILWPKIPSDFVCLYRTVIH